MEFGRASARRTYAGRARYAAGAARSGSFNDTWAAGEVLLGQFHDPETAAAATAKAKARSATKHAGRALPLDAGAAPGRPQGSKRSPLGAMANCFDPDPEPTRLAAKQKKKRADAERGAGRHVGAAQWTSRGRSSKKAERRRYGKKARSRWRAGRRRAIGGRDSGPQRGRIVKPAELGPAPGTEPPKGLLPMGENKTRRPMRGRPRGAEKYKLALVARGCTAHQQIAENQASREMLLPQARRCGARLGRSACCRFDPGHRPYPESGQRFIENPVIGY